MEPSLSNQNYVRLEHSNLDHKNYVVVNWCVGNTCNYSCSYCPVNLHDGKMKWPELAVVKTFVDKAIKHYKGKKIYFELTGGEVTLWNDLPEVVAYLREKGCKVGIISNGSRSLEFFTRLIDKIDHICLSFHPESENEDHFYSVVELFAQKIRTHVNFMMKPELFNRCVAFSLKVKNIPNISIALQPLMEGLSGSILDYSDLQKKTMAIQHELLVRNIKYTKQYEYYRGTMAMVSESGERHVVASQQFISAQQNSWKDWTCYAGLEQIVIDMNGGIYRGWCLAGGSIGTISDKELVLPMKPIVCAIERCHCNLDIMSTKVKNPMAEV